MPVALRGNFLQHESTLLSGIGKPVDEGEQHTSVPSLGETRLRVNPRLGIEVPVALRGNFLQHESTLLSGIGKPVDEGEQHTSIPSLGERLGYVGLGIEAPVALRGNFLQHERTLLSGIGKPVDEGEQHTSIPSLGETRLRGTGIYYRPHESSTVFLAASRRL